jgi:hypothetical protein
MSRRLSPRPSLLMALALTGGLVGLAPLVRAQADPPVQAAPATNVGIGRYQTRYGAPQDIDLEELIGMEARHETYPHAIRTRGRFELVPPTGTPSEAAATSGPAYRLCRGALNCLGPIRPVDEIAAGFDARASGIFSREIEVVGALEGGRFLFWSHALATLSGGREEGFGGPTIEGLVNQQSPFGTRDVTVRGQFRGGNIFDDLPAGSSATPSDWVLSDGPFSLWVTGKPPKGKGFSLSPASKADCVYWLEVTGRPERRGEVVVLKAGTLRFLGRTPTPAPPPGQGPPPGGQPQHRRRGP